MADVIWQGVPDTETDAPEYETERSGFCFVLFQSSTVYCTQFYFMSVHTKVILDTHTHTHTHTPTKHPTHTHTHPHSATHLLRTNITKAVIITCLQDYELSILQ